MARTSTSVSIFHLTEEHLKLLRNSCTTWDHAEYGAPGIDPKRPYGNSGVAEDICGMLDWKVPADEDEAGWDAVRNQARALHAETETALQILLCFAGEEVRPGEYRSVGWRTWERVSEKDIERSKLLSERDRIEQRLKDLDEEG